MAFLTLNGTEYLVLTENAQEEEPAWGGMNVEFSFDGSLRADFQPEVRKFSFGLQPMSEAAFQTLKTMVAAAVTVNGDCVNNVSMSALVVLKGRGFIANVASHLRTPVIEVVEIL